MKPVAAVLILLLFSVFALPAHAAGEWTKQDSGTLAWLYDIFFLDAQNGWIVGSRGEFLTTGDGGATWEKQPRFTEDSIKRVYFADRLNGWLLCQRDIYGGSSGGESPSYLLKTADGGKSWEKVGFAGARRRRVTNIFFTSKNFGLATGEAGALFAMTDDKSAWRLKALPVRYLLVDGFFTDDFHGTIVGGGGTILLTEDAGASWKPAAVRDPDRTKLNAVFYLNRHTGWAVGDSGKIFQTVSGGKRWWRQNSSVKTDLNDVCFRNTAEGWVVGDGGTILHTTTGGNIWRKQETKTRHKLEKVFFHASGRGWAIGFGGTILTYRNGASEISRRGRPASPFK